MILSAQTKKADAVLRFLDLKLLNDIRAKFEAAGAQEMADYVYEKAKKRTDIGF
jgi:hypothetical protein